jgi:hypothetical protein
MLDPNKTIVRGADGLLYYMTPTGPLTRVPPDEELAWNNAVDNIIQPALNNLFADQMVNVAASCHQTVQIVIPEVELN